MISANVCRVYCEGNTNCQTQICTAKDPRVVVTLTEWVIYRWNLIFVVDSCVLIRESGVGSFLSVKESCVLVR